MKLPSPQKSNVRSMNPFIHPVSSKLLLTVTMLNRMIDPRMGTHGVIGLFAAPVHGIEWLGVRAASPFGLS